jgi:hypothetical protein
VEVACSCLVTCTDDGAAQSIETPDLFRDRRRLERAVAAARDAQLDLADVGRDRRRLRAVAAGVGASVGRPVGFVGRRVDDDTPVPTPNLRFLSVIAIAGIRCRTHPQVWTSGHATSQSF